MTKLDHINIEAKKWLENINNTYKKMLENNKIFDLKRAKKVYNTLEEFSGKIDKKFHSIQNEINKLKMKLMKATFKKDIANVEEILQKVEIMKSQYL